MNRRDVIGLGIAGGLLGTTGLTAQIFSGPPIRATKAFVTLDGNTYVYPDGPKLASYDVAFRPDGRVLFHYGALWSGTVGHLGPHHVKLMAGNTTVFDAEIPRHFWQSEWTWRPAAPDIIRKPDQIVAERLMFEYGNPGTKVGKVGPYQFRGPMDNAGITVYMPTTGERPDIGLITDPSAFFMLTWDPSPMLAWAYAAGSCTMHYRDENTGKPIDLLKYPKANNYGVKDRQGTPWFEAGPEIKDGWAPDTAHWPEMSYVAYIATGDLGFLEDLQHAANYVVFCDAYWSNEKDGALLGVGQTRAIAWGLRNIAMAHIATKDAEGRGVLPDSCHPSSYFATLLENSRKFLTKWMQDPTLQIFRLLGPTDNWAPWQIDYLMLSLGFIVLTGHKEWSDLYLWTLGNVIARTDGKSGYPPGYGTAYYLRTVPEGVRVSDPGQTPPGVRYSSWAEAFDAFFKTNSRDLTPEQYSALKKDPNNDWRPMAGHEYLMTTRGALVTAAHLHKMGLVDILKAYPNFANCKATVDRMIANLDSDPGWRMNLRCAIVDSTL